MLTKRRKDAELIRSVISSIEGLLALRIGGMNNDNTSIIGEPLACTRQVAASRIVVSRAMGEGVGATAAKGIFFSDIHKQQANFLLSLNPQHCGYLKTLHVWRLVKAKHYLRC